MWECVSILVLRVCDMDLIRGTALGNVTAPSLPQHQQHREVRVDLSKLDWTYSTGQSLHHKIKVSQPHIKEKEILLTQEVRSHDTQTLVCTCMWVSGKGCLQIRSGAVLSLRLSNVWQHEISMWHNPFLINQTESISETSANPLVASFYHPHFLLPPHSLHGHC